MSRFLRYSILLVAAAIKAQQPAVPPATPGSGDRRVVGNVPDYHKNKAPAALGNSNDSLANLDAIRDRNLHRAQKDGCAPDAAARIADLKYQLDLLHARSGAPRAEASPGVSYTTIAAQWFQNPAAEVDSKASVEDLLDSVLPPSLAPAPKAAPKSDKRDPAQIRAEIQKLEASCVARN